MALPRRKIFTPGAPPRDYPKGLFDGQGDWDDWTFRQTSTSVWSQVQQPGTSRTKTKWVQDLSVGYGAGTHPYQKAISPNFEYEVHVALEMGNEVVLKGPSIGPAVNIRDRGVGLMPDLVSCLPLIIGTDRIILGFQWKDGVLTLPFSLFANVYPNDILSLYHKEASGLTEYHVSVNGKRLLASTGHTPINPHSATDMPGVMGVGSVIVSKVDYLSEWWVTASTGTDL